jgi:hypothetical protein
MIREIEENKEFVQWFGEWIARTGQRRASLERRRLDQPATVEEQAVLRVRSTGGEVNQSGCAEECSPQY